MWNKNDKYSIHDNKILINVYLLVISIVYKYFDSIHYYILNYYLSSDYPIHYYHMNSIHYCYCYWYWYCYSIHYLFASGYSTHNYYHNYPTHYFAADSIHYYSNFVVPTHYYFVNICYQVYPILSSYSL